MKQSKSLEELRSIDRWMMINTVSTVITGIATLILAIIALSKTQ